MQEKIKHTDNDKKHFYIHANYGASISFPKSKKTPLPKDKRKEPWPTIRKYKLKVNSIEDVNIEFMKCIKQHLIEHMESLWGKTWRK